jgi:hypothetical protein
MAATVSTQFKAQVSTGYQMISRVEVVSPAGATLLDSDNPATPLSVAGGSIRCDRVQSFRRYVENLVIIDEDGLMVPTLPSDFFSAITGNELRLHVGMMVNGEKEYVEQGTFGLAGARSDDTKEGLTITLTAFDRGRRFSRARRVTPKVFDALNSTPIYAAIVSTLQDVASGLLVFHDSPPHLTPTQSCNSGEDPWEFCRQLAESMGYELFFDRLGYCILQRIPDPNNVSILPSWVYTEGVNATMLELSRAQSNEQVYNGVVVTGMNPSSGLPPVRVLVWDDNPVSPTYYLGPYGKVPDFFQSDKIATVAQATDAGIGRLNEQKGLTEQVSFSIVPNPALEPSDVVQLIRDKSKLPASGPGSSPVVVDSFNLDLLGSQGEMVVTCRQRRLS